jgi:GPH family glycoside/pentoside/hexuronide:cation symporter
MQTLCTQWFLYCHARKGAATGVIGILMLAAFLLQGALNPIVGALSDRVRHRLGRRRPFVLLGAVPLLVAFNWLWHAGGVLGAGLAIVTFNVLWALTYGPFISILPGLAAAGPLLHRLSLLGALAGLLGVGAALTLGPVIVAWRSFEGLGLVTAVVFTVTVLAPLLALREAVPSSAPARFSLVTLARELGDVLGAPALRRFLAANALVFMAITGVTILVPYLVECLLGRPASYASTVNLWFFAGVVGAVVALGRLGRRHGATSLLRAGVALGAIAGVALGGGRLALGWAPPLPVWWLAFAALGVTTLLDFTNGPIIVTALARVDGRDRAGAFFGLHALAIAVGTAAGSLVTGLLLGLGHTPARPEGVAASLLAAGLELAASWLVLGGRDLDR